jgi:hypothetical protein
VHHGPHPRSLAGGRVSGGAARDGSGHVLVLGPSKTGTTGVYTAVKRGLAEAGVPTRSVFEPTSPDPLDQLFRYAPHHTVLVKVTMDRVDLVVPDVRVFDRRLMTVRDPRDTLISALLFRPLTKRRLHGSSQASQVAVDTFIQALEDKEADPGSRSVLALFQLAHQLGLGRPPFQSLAQALRQQRHLAAADLVHVLTYERFVSGDLAAASDYLGLHLRNEGPTTDSWIGHISRSRSSGEFLRWFHESDLEYFNHMFGESLRAFGYPPRVTLTPELGVEPATSSEFVRRVSAERRVRLSQRDDAEARAATSVQGDEVARLVERAQDGDAKSAVRAALLLREGHLDNASGADATDLARTAAQLGSRAGRSLLIELLEESGSTDAECLRELRVWRMASASEEARESLRRLRGSTRFRVGSALADIATHPVRRGPSASRYLSRITWKRLQRRGIRGPWSPSRASISGASRPAVPAQDVEEPGP